MLSALKLMKLGSALKDQRDNEGAFSAVMELGRMGRTHPKAVDLLIGALSRLDKVARSAARELGRIGEERAAQPLANLLDQPEVQQSAAEALLQLGSKAVPVLMATLQHESAEARMFAARTLGDIGDRRAVEPLIEVLTHDNDYGVRTAAATALGLLKDQRAVWVLVGTLKLRGETDPERQQALDALLQAASLAMRKIGDPLAPTRNQSAPGARGELAANADALLENAEQTLEHHPRLVGDLTGLDPSALVEVLKEIVAASEEVSWAKHENREPLLASYFRAYNQRQEAAETVGRELMRRGGRALLNQVLQKELNGHSAVANWWAALS